MLLSNTQRWQLFTVPVLLVISQLIVSKLIETQKNSICLINSGEK